MLTHTTRWSHPPGNAVVPSPWQATARIWTGHGVLAHNLVKISTLAA